MVENEIQSTQRQRFHLGSDMTACNGRTKEAKSKQNRVEDISLPARGSSIPSQAHDFVHHVMSTFFTQ